MSIEASDHADIFISHRYEEHIIDLGDVRMNFAVAGSDELPALLLIPAQAESWWGYEDALDCLSEHFQTFAVDLRGQGRSTWTPGRYTLDIWGNDLVRFIDTVIGRPTIVSGNSSGGVLAAWLSAYSKPGQIRGALLEDPPLFASEINPSVGPSIHQSLGSLFALFSKWLGDQWSVGDWKGMQTAAMNGELPASVAEALESMEAKIEGQAPPDPDVPTQTMLEYDPEWARAFYTGSGTVGVDHERMLSAVRVPVLLTHHFREMDPTTGNLLGAVSDLQVRRAGELITEAGQPFEVRDLPQMPHEMHRQEPRYFAELLAEFAGSLPA